MKFKVVDCDAARAEEILEILNEAIINSTALWDYAPRSPSAMGAWFAAKQSGGFPVLGVTDERGTLAGFASYGPFRHFPAYKYTVEHSVYIHVAYRGRGLGKLLLEALIQRAEASNYRAMIAAIDDDNEVSKALHQRLGFTCCGVIREAGYKFGRWLDLALYQRLLSGPPQPVDG